MVPLLPTVQRAELSKADEVLLKPTNGIMKAMYTIHAAVDHL